MNLKHTKEALVTKNDMKIIERVVCANPDKDYAFYIQRIRTEIKNITDLHYIVLGQVIGQISATNETLEDIFINLNPLSKCREN